METNGSTGGLCSILASVTGAVLNHVPHIVDSVLVLRKNLIAKAGKGIFCFDELATKLTHHPESHVLSASFLPHIAHTCLQDKRGRFASSTLAQSSRNCTRTHSMLALLLGPS